MRSHTAALHNKTTIPPALPVIHFSYKPTHPTHTATFFFFNDTATTEIYPLPLPDALPIFAPTADLSATTPIDEGSSSTVSFANQSDPSTADTNAGFHYAYSCSNGDLSGATYANTAGSTSSTQCTYNDGVSNHTVKARIIDKDNGFTEYTTVVHVLYADLTVAKTAPPSTIAGAAAGFDYTLTVTNNGPDANVGGFHVNDTLPSGTNFSSSGSSAGCSAVGLHVTCLKNFGLASSV